MNSVPVPVEQCPEETTSNNNLNPILKYSQNPRKPNESNLMNQYDEKCSLYLSQAKPTACLEKKKKIQGTLTKKPLGYFFISVWQNEPEQRSRFGRII